MTPITSVSTLRTTALSNAGAFAAAFARAPKSVTFKGKTYLRDAARSVEERLWYLGVAASTQPSALRSMASGSYSLDEVYGLDPDRSRVDMAEQALATAQGNVQKVQSRLNGLRAQVRSLESQKRNAEAQLVEARKFNGADVVTFGIAMAGRIAYAEGQVKLWQDRIDSVKNGALVGMAAQEGFQVPVNDGIAQNEAKLEQAKGEVRAAQSELMSARSSYDAEARQMRQAEEAARREQASAETERQLAEAEARRREQEAQARLAASQAAANSQMYEEVPVDPNGGYSDPSGWETVGDEDSYESEEPDWGDFGDELDTARDMTGGDEEMARAYAEDILGAEEDVEARLEYVSPYSFDSYYGADCDGSCDGHCESCDEVAELREQMLDAGWGFDGMAYFADKLGDEDEQGASGRTGAGGTFLTPPPMVSGSAAAPFDFMSIIPLILTAVLALAPLIISAFAPPVAMEDAQPPKSVIDDVRAQQGAVVLDEHSDEKTRMENLAVYGGGAALLIKLLA